MIATELGPLVASCRELVGLTVERLAVRAAVSDAVVREVEQGAQLPDWRLVDALVLELEVAGKTGQAKQLVALRSHAESHLHGVPGTLCLCGGETLFQWHWVRRVRGQVYCGEHEQFLMPGCYFCGFRFAELATEPTRCPGCNAPIEAMIENVEYYQDDLAQDEREVVARLRQCRQGVLYGDDDHVRRPRPLTLAEQVASHNRAHEHTVEHLSGRALEHYRAAHGLHVQLEGKTFRRGELVDAYLGLAPGKEPTTVLPSDFCLNANQQAAENPWFLVRVERGRYQFVGIDGAGDRGKQAPQPEDAESSHESG